MAEGLSPTAAGQALTALKGIYTFAKLHVGAPGAAGTANPAVETDRVAATFPTTVSTQSMTNTNTLTWPGVAGTEDYTHISFWSASTGGVFGMSGVITANPVTAGDTFQLDPSSVTVSLPIAS